jgi:hypothetical protein
VGNGLQACETLGGDVAFLHGEAPPLHPETIGVALTLAPHAHVGQRTHHGLGERSFERAEGCHATVRGRVRGRVEGWASQVITSLHLFTSTTLPGVPSPTMWIGLVTLIEVTYLPGCQGGQ